MPLTLRNPTWKSRGWRFLHVAALLPPLLVHAQPRHAPPAVAVSGTGPETWVLVAGLVGGVAGYRRLEASLLARGARVVIIDPFQLSLDSADVTFHALARRVDRALEALGVADAHVVGHSHGGGVALRLAANAPARVRSLTLLDVGAMASSDGPVLAAALRLVPVITRLPGGQALVRRKLVDGLRENGGNGAWLDPATESRYVDPLLAHVDPAVSLAIRVGRAHEPEPLPAVVARVRAPVLVLLGTLPRRSRPAPAEITALEPLGSLLVVRTLRGVAHFPHEEAPAETLRHVLDAGPAARHAEVRR